jgi:hypothetical protein
MLIDPFTWIPQIWVSSFLKITLVDLAGTEVCRELPPGTSLDVLLQVEATSDLNFNTPFVAAYENRDVVSFDVGPQAGGTPLLALSTEEIDFTATQLGVLSPQGLRSSPSGASAEGESRPQSAETQEKTFTVTNEGTGVMKGGLTLIADGSGSNVFILVSDDTLQLEPGQSQAVTVRYTAVDTTPATGSLRISTNGGVESVVLRGGGDGGPLPTCDDGDLCTDDSLDTNNTCAFTPKVCPTGQACNGANGACEPSSCDDKNLCTTDSVDPATHACAFTPKVCPTGQACNPSNGACEPTSCDDGKLCTTDSADSATHACVNIPVSCPTGSACNPNNGACEPVSCDDENFCTTDSVDPSTHTCVFTPNCPPLQFCSPNTGNCTTIFTIFE